MKIISHAKLCPLQSVCWLLAFLSFYCSNAQIPGEIWGTTSRGGSNDYGVIFKTSSDGTGYSVEYNFGENGIWPRGGLIQAKDGLLYGLTSTGKNGSLLFSFNPSNREFSEKYFFNKTEDGFNPRGSLIQAKNGKLYGVTYLGGINAAGVLFEYDLENNTYRKKFDFGGTNGAFPNASLMEASNGKIYGSTFFGGLGYGVLFEFDADKGSFQKLVNLDEVTGGQPLSSLIEVANGKLYGTTYDVGVLFELDINSRALTKKFSFNSEIGSRPAGLVLANNKKIYGMTSSFDGTIFEYDPATNVSAKKLDFIGANGSTPYGTLMLADNGNLYGVTFSGGESNSGVLFEYNTVTNSLIKKFDFSKAFGSRPEYVQLLQYREVLVVTGSADLKKAEKAVTLFPNPTKDKISIYVDGLEEHQLVRIDMLDIIGTIVDTRYGDLDMVNELNVSTLSDGIYFIKITLGEESYIKKFLKGSQFEFP